MIRIDLLADADMLVEVEAHAAGDAAERFGQCHRRTAVQYAHGLLGPVIDGHRRAQVIGSDLRQSDAEMLDHGSGHPLGETLERERAKPDAHMRGLASQRRQIITPPSCYEWQP